MKTYLEIYVAQKLEHLEHQVKGIYVLFVCKYVKICIRMFQVVLAREG